MKNKGENIISYLEGKVRAALIESDVRRVVVGVSGGADSVALLTSLKRVGAEPRAVHCNFHLRGEESDRDMNFTEELCRKSGVALDIVHFDVEQYRLSHKNRSVEMACRELRYDYFKRKVEEYGADRLAVAHNSDDNAETLLLNLFRGGGVAGLRAMKKDTGLIIRPLLQVSREEIEHYLSSLSIPYIIDSTNLSSDYRRNFIRNEVIPLIEKEWHGVKQSLNRTARIMGEEERMLEDIIGDDLMPDCLPMSKIEEAVRGRWIVRRYALSRGASAALADEIVKTIGKGKESIGAHWLLGTGTLVFSLKGLEWLEEKSGGNEMDIEGSFEWVSHPNSPRLIEQIKRERDNSIFRTSLPPEEIRIRRRREGDRMRPIGMKGSRLISDMARDARMGAAERRDLIVAEHIPTGNILWAEGLRRSAEGLISPEDEIIWELKRK